MAKKSANTSITPGPGSISLGRHRHNTAIAPYSGSANLKGDDAVVHHTTGEKDAQARATSAAAAAVAADRAARKQLPRQRRDLLASKIDRAIERAGDRDPGSVFAQLREMALNEEPPFNHVDSERGLKWTPAKGAARWLTVGDLKKRLAR